MKKAKITALCGMMSALSVVIMLASSIIPVLMYVLPVVSGYFVWYISELINKKYAIGVYFSTSILSLILLTDKETALAYALFFGFYPIIRFLLNRLPKVLCFVSKILLFNVCALAVGYIGVAVFGVSADEYTEFGKWTIPILLGMANSMFLLYENTMNKLKILIDLAVNNTKKYLR